MGLVRQRSQSRLCVSMLHWIESSMRHGEVFGHCPIERTHGWTLNLPRMTLRRFMLTWIRFLQQTPSPAESLTHRRTVCWRKKATRDQSIPCIMLSWTLSIRSHKLSDQLKSEGQEKCLSRKRRHIFAQDTMSTLRMNHVPCRTFLFYFLSEK